MLATTRQLPCALLIHAFLLQFTACTQPGSAPNDASMVSVPDTKMNDQPHQNPPAPSPKVGVEPIDLTSDAAHARVRILLVAVATEIDPLDIQAIASAATLVDETGSSIPFDVEVTTEPTGVFNPATNRTFVDLIPVDPLPSGWNQARLSEIPDGWSTYSSWSRAGDGDAAYVARIAGGSSPVVQSIEVCAGEGSAVQKLIVRFSQSVKAVGASPASMDGRACRVLSHDESVSFFQYVCDAAGLPELVTLDLNGIVSNDGIQTKYIDSDLKRLDFRVDEFDRSGNPCRLLRF